MKKKNSHVIRVNLIRMDSRKSLNSCGFDSDHPDNHAIKIKKLFIESKKSSNASSVLSKFGKNCKGQDKDQANYLD